VAAPAIETHGLSKTYGKDVRALADLELRVETGEVFGYLGPNGAGKSTTIRILLDLIRPTEGSASLLGLDSRRDGVQARRQVGYLPGDLHLYDRLTAREQLDSLSRLRRREDAKLREELCQRFGVVLDRPIRQLSKGNRQKVGVVQAFMHRPQLVILDEPTSGLDPLLQAEFRDLLRETAADGRTVFLSSHSLDEVQHVAHRIAIIRSGRLVDVDSVERLRERALRHVTIAGRPEWLRAHRRRQGRGKRRTVAPALGAGAGARRDRQGGGAAQGRRPRLGGRRSRGDLPRVLRGVRWPLSCSAAACSTTAVRSSAGV
jgi:ABC-2 type transport system ATP-binding protein